MELLTLEPQYYFGDGGDLSTPNSWIQINFYPTNEALKTVCYTGMAFEVLGRTAQEIIDASIDQAGIDIIAALQGTPFAGLYYYEPKQS